MEIKINVDNTDVKQDYSEADILKLVISSCVKAVLQVQEETGLKLKVDRVSVGEKL